jgi:hypothetical protein
MPARNPIPLEGVLNSWNDPYDLPDLLLAVSRSGKTGRLSFSSPEGDKTVYMKEGKIIFAESSSDDDGLGQHLLLNGRISLEDFTRVSKLVSPGKRLGALLVAEGVLEPKDLVPAVVDQVRAIILGLFRRTESWYRFKEEELPRKESITLDIPFAQLVLDGVQLIDSWRRISKGVGDLDSVYQVNGATEVEWSRLNLESGPTELLTLLNEPMRLADVCAEASIDDFDACRYLWAFKALDWIEPAELSVSDAAELADQAEISSPLAMAPMAPVPEPAPAPPLPDLASTVMNLEPPAPIPQRLVETQVSAVKEGEAPRAPKLPAPRPVPANLNQTQLAVDMPEPPAPGPATTLEENGPIPKPEAPRAQKPRAPRPVPANLNHTQLAVEMPEPPPPSPAMTQPEVAPIPKAVPDALHHTQLFLDAPKEASPPPPDSTPGEMMEAILEGKGEAPSAPRELEEPAFPEARSNNSTQFFPGASALETPPPAEEDFFKSSPEFGSLSLDYAASPPAELSGAPASESSASSFSSFAEMPPPPSEPEAEMPLIEATVIEATVVEEVKPIPPHLAATQPSVPTSPDGPSGLEFFALNDPFQSPQTPPPSTPPPSAPQPLDVPSPPPTAFATDDPMQYAQTSIAASLPGRPRTEELDLDIGHFFRRDEDK